jgi:hypothetical protein
MHDLNSNNKLRKIAFVAVSALLVTVSCIFILTRANSNNSGTMLMVEDWAGSDLEQQLHLMREKLQHSASILQSHKAPDSNVWEQDAAQEWDRVMGRSDMLAGRPPSDDDLSRSSFVIGDAASNHILNAMPSSSLQSEIMAAPSPLVAPQPPQLLPSPYLQPAELSIAPPGPAAPPAIMSAPPGPVAYTSVMEPSVARADGRPAGLSPYQESMLRAMLDPPAGHGPPAARAGVHAAQLAARPRPRPAKAAQALAARADTTLSRADDVLARAAAEEDAARAAAARRLRAEQGVLAQATWMSKGVRGVLEQVGGGSL